MVLVDNIISSPLRRPQALKKQWDELGGWSTLVQRHRFLLTALVLLTVLCTVYLYFAVTFGANGSCSGLIGVEKSVCLHEHAGAGLSRGKLKFF